MKKLSLIGIMLVLLSITVYADLTQVGDTVHVTMPGTNIWAVHNDNSANTVVSILNQADNLRTTNQQTITTITADPTYVDNPVKVQQVTAAQAVIASLPNAAALSAAITSGTSGCFRDCGVDLTTQQAGQLANLLAGNSAVAGVTITVPVELDFKPSFGNQGATIPVGLDEYSNLYNAAITNNVNLGKAIQDNPELKQKVKEAGVPIAFATQPGSAEGVTQEGVSCPV